MEFNYKANYLKAGLIVNQTQTIAELLNNGQSFSEIKLELEFKNILNTKSPVTAKTYFSIIQSRLELLNSDFWNLIRYSDKELSVQTIFVASIKFSQLVGDFLRFTLRERLELYYDDCPYSAWDAFIEQCYSRDANMSKFSSASYNKLRNQTYNILIEAGFISDIKKKLICKPFFRPELLKLLNQHNEVYVLSCLDGMIW